MKGAVMAEGFADYISRERDRLNAERQQLNAERAKIDQKLAAIEAEFKAVTAYEHAKSGKPANTRTGRGRVARRECGDRVRTEPDASTLGQGRAVP